MLANIQHAFHIFAIPPLFTRNFSFLTSNSLTFVRTLLRGIKNMKRKKKREIRRWKSEKYSHATTLFVRATLLLFVTGMLMLLLSRLSVLWAYGENVRHTSFLPDLLRAFAMGARFDAKVIATLLFPLLLFLFLFLLSILSPKNVLHPVLSVFCG